MSPPRNVLVVRGAIDNGAGFDPLATKRDGRSHIGLDNVRNRLASMYGGSFMVDSVIGMGTTVCIAILKGGAAT